ncbi:MAG: hypothetical protein Q4E53_08885 [Eubacteriales bacterium]|nr:hypothetical protein [Eubacteriales bacterium]
MAYSTGDYGWLAPDGRFYEVPWGEHQSWATKHIKETGLYEKLTLKERICADGLGDVLMNHGWILLHNPRHGLAKPTKKEEKRFTKAQADFLYDYYIERNEHDMANSIFNED